VTAETEAGACLGGATSSMPSYSPYFSIMEIICLGVLRKGGRNFRESGLLACKAVFLFGEKK